MQKSIIFLVLSVVFVVSCAMSCEEFDDFVPDLYLKEISVQNMDNSGASPVYLSSPSDSIHKEAFVLDIKFYGTTTPNGDNVSAELKDRPLSYFRDYITGYRIEAITHFDDEHPAGSDVTALFAKFSDYSDRYYYDKNYTRFALMKPPKKGTYSFRVYVLREYYADVVNDSEPVYLY